jgi:peptidoglycan biosynthesis protein MviN/MurJ (putative lipid II flippase)
MNNSKNGLDEMQKQRRNSVGNQMFMIMTYLMFINIGLNSFEITWIGHPASTLLIVVACLTIYLVRLIALNAYLPAREQSSKTRLIGALVGSIVIAIVISVFIFLYQTDVDVSETLNVNEAVVLMIASSVGLMIVLIVAVVKKANNKNDKEE